MSFNVQSELALLLKEAAQTSPQAPRQNLFLLCYICCLQVQALAQPSSTATSGKCYSLNRSVSSLFFVRLADTARSLIPWHKSRAQRLGQDHILQPQHQLMPPSAGCEGSVRALPPVVWSFSPWQQMEEARTTSLHCSGQCILLSRVKECILSLITKQQGEILLWHCCYFTLHLGWET